MVQGEKEDVRLRWWAIFALVLIGLVYALPNSLLETLVAKPETNIVLRIAVAGTLLAGVLGFYLRMFVECGFSVDVYRRGGWLLLFVFVPIFSAFIYFFVTRSARYKEHVRRVRSINNSR